MAKRILDTSVLLNYWHRRASEHLEMIDIQEAETWAKDLSHRSSVEVRGVCDRQTISFLSETKTCPTRHWPASLCNWHTHHSSVQFRRHATVGPGLTLELGQWGRLRNGTRR